MIMIGLKLYLGYVIGSFLVGLTILSLLLTMWLVGALLEYHEEEKRRKNGRR
jgi:general stress protein CsbA